MSGIEVVSLVLGAFPVVVWCLKQYKAPLEAFDFSKNKAQYIDRLIRALEAQRALISNDLKGVLIRIGVDREEVLNLELSEMDELLRDESLSARLTEYLGGTHKDYLNALEDCKKTLTVIARDISGLVPSAHKMVGIPCSIRS